jgi:hypothetical protein
LLLQDTGLFLHLFRGALLAGGLPFEIEPSVLEESAAPQPRHEKTRSKTNGGDQNGDSVHRQAFGMG